MPGALPASHSSNCSCLVATEHPTRSKPLVNDTDAFLADDKLASEIHRFLQESAGKITGQAYQTIGKSPVYGMSCSGIRLGMDGHGHRWAQRRAGKRHRSVKFLRPRRASRESERPRPLSAKPVTFRARRAADE